jgi:hypothetical protein
MWVDYACSWVQQSVHWLCSVCNLGRRAGPVCDRGGCKHAVSAIRQQQGLLAPPSAGPRPPGPACFHTVHFISPTVHCVLGSLVPLVPMNWPVSDTSRMASLAAPWRRGSKVKWMGPLYIPAPPCASRMHHTHDVAGVRQEVGWLFLLSKAACHPRHGGGQQQEPPPAATEPDLLVMCWACAGCRDSIRCGLGPWRSQEWVCKECE